MTDDADKTGDDMVQVSKAELDALKESSGRVSKLEKDLEDVRMEVLTPEYTSFLESIEKGTKKEDTKETKDSGEIDFSKLTPKQIFEEAKKAAREEAKVAAKEESDRIRGESKTEADAKTKREIVAFAKDHEDFETFRPMMYGLSKDPNNADLTLEQLFNKAKEQIYRIAKEPTPEQKEKQKRIGNEKPGNDSQSFEKIKKMSNAEIAKSSLDDLKKELGPIPSS